MIGNVDDGEQDAEVVAPLEISDPRVYILGVEAVIFQTAVFANAGLRQMDSDTVQGTSESHATRTEVTYLRNRAHVVRPSP